jgi:hypothetical protein
MTWVIGCLLHYRTRAIPSAAIPRRPCIISLSSFPLLSILVRPLTLENWHIIFRVFSSPGWHHCSQIAKLHHESTQLSKLCYVQMTIQTRTGQKRISKNQKVYYT